MEKQMIKPYGDTMDDGLVQLSFTLPVENGPRARKAAQEYAALLNLTNVTVADAKKIADGFTCFVIYARASAALDYSVIRATEADFPKMEREDIDRRIDRELGRRIVVVGGAIGTDAHTVGIDAIMNMKGYRQDYGLERYSGFMAVNMGAQVAGALLLEKGLETGADAILVSQTVTKNNIHIRQMTEFMTTLNGRNMRGRFILVAGGARLDNDLALRLGYDAGFGPGTLPSQVASFLAQNVIKRHGKRGG